MTTALSEGQFPVRWAPDLRYGEPLFNFYAPLPYYLGALIKISGISYIWVAKILFILSAFLSGLAMYFFCKEIFDKKSAFLAALLYVYAPYRAVDMYVRGALSETWVFVFFPLIFHATLLLSRKVNLKRIIFLSLSLAGLFLTHNISTIMFAPFLGLFMLYLLVINKEKLKILISFFVSSVLSFGIAASYLLPAFFEKQFIQTQYLVVGYFNFRTHFVALSQFFSTFWGYGTSGYGINDGLSFQVGIINWIMVAVSLFLAIIFRKDRKYLGIFLCLGISFFLSLLLQHTKSDFIWESIPLMAFIQFPWRFLAISIFIASITGALVMNYLQKISFLSSENKFKIIFIALIFGIIAVNLQYFRPKEYVDDSFFDKFQNVETLHKGVDLTKDYLPIWVQTTEGDRFDTPRAQTGKIEVSGIQKTSVTYNASISVLSNSLIEMPVTFFPGWEVLANNQIIAQRSPSKMGLIRFELPQGNFNIHTELKDTPIRIIGNEVSVFSLVIIVLLFGLRKKYLNA